ncbi:hypothetical protein [Roseateles microcysteis]|uniref:hypothetical protein n=1 Tax=Roseateles microcysteis TaxID=3119057 RepID=UPI002FE692E7
MRKTLARLFRFYVDLPLVVAFLLLVVIFRRALFDELLMPLAEHLSKAAQNSVAETLILGVISNVITALLLAAIALAFFRLLMRSRLSGDYKAFQIEGDQEIPYGTAKILFSPLALDRGGIPVKLRLDHDDLHLEGQGHIVNNSILIGHYIETGKPERRRCGSFFYRLDGTGDTWHGHFLYVSPDTAETITGVGKWSRI